MATEQILQILGDETILLLIFETIVKNAEFSAQLCESCRNRIRTMECQRFSIVILGQS